jgi:hypothetical protein
MLTNRDEGGELRPPQWELEDGSFDEPSPGLAEGTITRAQAIKLAGAALLGGALTVLWADEADARKRRRKKRRRRRKAQVTDPLPLPVPVPNVENPGIISITFPVLNLGDKDLEIGDVKVVDGGNDGLADAELLNGPVTIEAGQTEPVTVNLTVTSPLIETGELRLIENDASGTPITVIDENGVTVGDIGLDFNPVLPPVLP